MEEEKIAEIGKKVFEDILKITGEVNKNGSYLYLNGKQYLVLPMDGHLTALIESSLRLIIDHTETEVNKANEKDPD